MAVVGPLAACPCLSFLPAWQVNRTGRKGSLQVNENSESVRAGIVCTHHCMYTSLYVHIIVCTHPKTRSNKIKQDQTRSNKIKQDQTRSKKTGIIAPPCSICTVLSVVARVPQCHMDHTYLPQIGAFDPFLGRIVFEGVGETGQTKKNICGKHRKKWQRKSGKGKEVDFISLYVPYIGPTVLHTHATFLRSSATSDFFKVDSTPTATVCFMIAFPISSCCKRRTSRVYSLDARNRRDRCRITSSRTFATRCRYSSFSCNSFNTTPA